MYNTKTAIVNNEEFNSNYMPVGINNDVTLKSVTVEKSPQGKDFLRVTFENEAGQTAEFTEWKNEKNMWIKTDEDLQNRDNIQFGRILQLINSFTTLNCIKFLAAYRSCIAFIIIDIVYVVVINIIFLINFY